MRKFCLRISLLFFCLFILNGCATKLAYSFLDFATLWYIERYVNLDSEQKKYAKNYLDKFHSWHRETQLTRYALYLEGLHIRIGTGILTGQQVHDETDRIQVLVGDCLDYLTPLFIELAATLSDDQVKALMAKLAKERNDYQKEFIDIDEPALYKARIDELKSHLVLGGLNNFNDEQKQKLREWSETMLPFEALTLRQQEIWAEELLEALTHRKDRAQLDTTIRKLLFVHTDEWNEELEIRMDKNQSITYAMLADLLNGRTPAQQKRMKQKISGYITDFRELAISEAENAEGTR
ncbi:DUF6279 family lipoprotein [Teredinibacter purpureus]|uniref:DUF6279 family lipoprotein n=1 Tax=Teredinibacter purpureus TaxID=2731756 RepID=UPI0005F85E1C|nr:DUF6279 family lipoprotein [Teredinibacter purpureus]